LEPLDPLSAASTNGAVNHTHAKANTIQRRIMSKTIPSILRNGAELRKQSLSESSAYGELHLYETSKLIRVVSCEEIQEGKR
jgi:hypothetical protein